ncbi:MAG: extracellular solute-binding protein [Planctomycetota bacterium]
MKLSTMHHQTFPLWLSVVLLGLFCSTALPEGPAPDPRHPKEVPLTVWTLPRPEGTGVDSKCQRAILKRFKEKYPWISLSSPTGLSIPEMSGMDTRPLMAIAGGVSPDVIYVNFRQADTYIREGFLYPLDPWWEGRPVEERDERVIPQVNQVIFRWGPSKATMTKEAWETFARDGANARVLRVRPEERAAYVAFLEKTYSGRIESLNREYQTNYGSFDDAPLPAHEEISADRLSDWTAFLKATPIEHIYHRDGKDTNKHYWALPYGTLFKGILWRKDLFQKVGLDPERPPQNWDEYYEFAKKCTNPDEGTYALLWPKSIHWSWYFFSILNSAGARAMQDFGEDDWHVTFNTPEAVTAYEFMLKLVQRPFRTPDGRIVEGVVCQDAASLGTDPWAEGRVAMMETYLRDDLLVNINPELVGLAPVPMGPTGARAAEINCTMNGIFSGAAKKGPDVLEAAWLYVHFLGSPEAMEIKTRVLVENGYGLFANPKYLERLGYHDYLRRIPPSWRQALKLATKDGEPEPYGRNTQMVYNYMSIPADELLEQNVGTWVFDAVEKKREDLKKKNPAISESELGAELKKVEDETSAKVRERVQNVLNVAVDKAEAQMVGIIPPKEMKRRRLIAGSLALVIGVAFFLLFRHVIKVFTPPGAKGGWMFRKYWLAYVLLIPGVGTIALWQYFPLVRGAMMAFQDYHIVLPTSWIGLDNFAHVLWDSYFWNSLWVSVEYAFLSIAMGFFAPIVIAILLHEIPRGKVLFRTIYYLPAVVSGLVVMLMWKNFFEPSDRGLLNQIVTAVSPLRFLLIGAVVTLMLGLGSYFNFKRERRVAAPVMGVLAVLSAVLFVLLAKAVAGMPDQHIPAQKWLQDPYSALVCVILPTVWAGMGPGCLIYLAALKTIPEDFYEAADIDGAGFFSKIWHITVPTIKVLIVIQFIGAFVGAFQTSGYILVMTGGGPNRATEVTALKIFYDAFVFLRFGFATATAWILGFLLIGFTVFQLKRLSKVEFRTAG